MSPIVITKRTEMLLTKKWKALDKHARKGYVPWQMVTVIYFVEISARIHLDLSNKKLQRSEF